MTEFKQLAYEKAAGALANMISKVKCSNCSRTQLIRLETMKAAAQILVETKDAEATRARCIECRDARRNLAGLAANTEFMQYDHIATLLYLAIQAAQLDIEKEEREKKK